MRMRYIYFFMKFTLPYSLHVFFKRIKTINPPKERLGRTFFVANHPSSFMDPLIPAAMNNPVVHFMACADIYEGLLKHVYHNTHILPVYRQQDGGDGQKKNEEVFQWVAQEVKRRKNILVFAEGFTDDVFIRSLKPLKKGFARMAFVALEELNWEEPVYLQAFGMNYTHPQKFRSEILMSYGEKILLNDFREEYEQNPNKAITDVTKLGEDMLLKEMTHLENREQSDFHENIMRLTRKGMHYENSDFSIPLEDRFKYSQRLANWLNTQNDDELAPLSDALADYFQELEAKNINENDVFEFSENGKISNTKMYLFNIFTAPLALLGLLHGWISYFIIKPKVQKSFKRSVFWSSVKIVGSHFVSGIYNALLLIPFYYCVFPSVLLGILYLVVITGPSFIVFRHWITNMKEIKRRSKISGLDLKVFAEKRSSMLSRIQEIIQVN